MKNLSNAFNLRDGIRKRELLAAAIAAGIDASFAERQTDEALAILLIAISEAQGATFDDESRELHAPQGSDLDVRRAIAHRNLVLERVLQRGNNS